MSGPKRLSDVASEAGRFLRVLCDPQLDPLFWRAALIDPDSAWCGHIPFAYWLVSATSPRVIVELGTHTGVSYMALCLAVEREQLNTRCFAVDTWHGDTHAGHYGEAVFTKLKTQHNNRFGAFSSLLRFTFDEAIPFIEDGSVDLLHIDGLHTYEAVRHDFETWRAKLSDRAVVLFHDTNERHGDFGVWRLWSELREQYPSFEFLHGHGLGVLAIGENVPAGLSEVLSARDPALLATLRSRFALLGERWEVEQHAQWLIQEHAAQLADRDQAHAAQLADRDQAHAAQLADRDQAINDLNGQMSALASKVQGLTGQLSAGKDVKRTLQKGLVEAETALATTRSDLERAQAQAGAAEQEQSRLRAALRDAQQVQRSEAALRHSLESSTAWRVTWPIRRALTAFPGLRRILRRSLRLAWWAATLQLGRRLRERRALIARARRVASSPLFDATWYQARYPDAAASDLAPSMHFVLSDPAERRDPGPEFSTSAYLDRHPDVAKSGWQGFLHYLEYGIAEGREHRPLISRPPAAAVPAVPTVPNAAPPTLSQLMSKHFGALEPLRAFNVPGDAPRVSMVTDSINAGSLFGGVATAIILSALLARHVGARLRLITLREPPEPSNVAAVLTAHRIPWTGDIEFAHTGPAREEVPVGDNELFLTTSWWSTRCVRPVVDPRRLVYLLQEDERMFYAWGDERLRCGEMLSDPKIRFVINSRILFDHMTQGPDALPNIAANSVWFEPAFPTFDRELAAANPAGGKRQFFFYARPHNLRNLYWRGLEAIGAALEENVLDPGEWDFHFAGRDLVPMELPRGVQPKIAQNLPWPDYVELIRRIDVGLCLMDTPHPSYPPLDLAAAGAIAVTNQHGSKTSLVQYSNGIICVEPSVEGLKRGIAEAVARSSDRDRRQADLAADHINRDWEAALAPVLARLYPNGRLG